jgi:predicted amidohydrolase
VERNLSSLERIVREAAACGAKFIATPEASTFLGPHAEKIKLAEDLDGEIATRLAKLAREESITLLIGSLAERCGEDPSKSYNTSVLFGPDGKVVATYRKMHLFDVDLSKSGGMKVKESDTTGRGEELVVADTVIGKVCLLPRDT